MSTQLSSNTEKTIKIFISHSSKDKELGELLLDFLLALGFNKNSIFILQNIIMEYRLEKILLML